MDAVLAKQDATHDASIPQIAITMPITTLRTLGRTRKAQLETMISLMMTNLRMMMMKVFICRVAFQMLSMAMDTFGSVEQIEILLAIANCLQHRRYNSTGIMVEGESTAMPGHQHQSHNFIDIPLEETIPSTATPARAQHKRHNLTGIPLEGPVKSTTTIGHLPQERYNLNDMSIEETMASTIIPQHLWHKNHESTDTLLKETIL